MNPIRFKTQAPIESFLVCALQHNRRVDMKAILARNLQAQLALKEWGQQELHRRSKVAQSTIGRILRRETAADVDTIGQIAKALDVEPWALLAPDFGEGTAALLGAVAKIVRDKTK